MNSVKYCILVFSFVLSNLIYSENRLRINTLNVPAEDSISLSQAMDTATCSKENAENIVRALPEVAEAQTRIESLTNNEKGISIMSDSRSIKGISYYAFQVGFDGPNRFETYYFLLVNKDNCSDIKIVDIISGELIPIKEWRKIIK